MLFLIFLSKIFNNMSRNDKNYQIFFDIFLIGSKLDLRELVMEICL